DVLYRLKTGQTVDANEVITLDGNAVTTVTTDTAEGKDVVAVGEVGESVRKVKAKVALGDGISFHYGIQAGMGGFVLRNSSSITGNVFSGGSIIGSGNNIYGDVISAGPSGLIDGIHATGTAFAHNIRETTSNQTIIDKDAHYVNKDAGVTVSGTLFPNSPDQAVIPLPISDEQITEWEDDALAGGTMLSSDCDDYSVASNTCTISGSQSLGPLKVPFNLLVKSSSGVLTLTGPLWVTGDFTTQTGPTIRIDPSLGSKNVALVADNPNDRSGSGIITVGQSTIFEGSGSPNSFVFLISQNNSGETGGSTDAVSMNQGASALVAYASHGQVTLSQSVSVKEVTAYKIILTQSANVVYDTGLPSVLFDSGPSGGYEILEWKEIE
ncbi:MAG: hypothetical protein COV96_00635, partial [Candidatus Zambryskibacteria bacterium CG11_big_fil_rev_8_21_14_0_20_42_18]